MLKGFQYRDKDPDLIVVLGGDGSLLRAFQDFKFKGNFVLINTGHLGFYSDYPDGDIDSLARDIEKNECSKEKIPLYEALYEGKTHYFTNDIVLQSSRSLAFDILVNGELLTKTRSTGIVIGSSIASTGYLSSLGSPLAVGNMKAYQYALIAPVFNRLYPNTVSKALIRDEDSLLVNVQSGHARASLDGIDIGSCNSDKLEVRKAVDKFVTLIHFRPVSPVERIKRSLTVSKEE
ncbi:MAG: NAD(+)/NADH kinase [Bacilli bacterium]